MVGLNKCERMNRRKHKTKIISPDDALKVLELYPKTKAVYDHIKDHPNISAQEIADAIGCQQVYAHVNRLEDNMLVSVQKQRKSNYTIKYYTAIEPITSHTTDAEQHQERKSESPKTAQARMSDSEYEKIFNECLFDDLDEDITNPNFLFSIGGVDCVSSGSIVAVSGKVGVGKSTALAIMVGVLISGFEFGTIQCKKKCPRILWMDTEKDPFTCKQRTMTIRSVANLAPDKSLVDQGISFLRMSTRTVEERISLLEKIAEENASNLVYDAVVIDGIFDLTDEPDNHRKVRRVIDLLKRFSGCGITVFGMLHTNKQAEDNNMREKIGTDFDRICTNCFLIKTEKERHQIIHKKSNNTQYAPVAAFKYDKTGIAVPFAETDDDADFDTPTKDSRTLANEERIRSILSDGLMLSRTELIKKMGEGSDGIKEETAKKAIKGAYDSGLINKEDGKYGKYYLAVV